MPSLNCYYPGCPEKVDLEIKYCKAGHFQGEINVLVARQEQERLQERYNAAEADVRRRIGDQAFEKFIDLTTRNSIAVCNFSPIAASNIFRNRKYLNYYKRGYQGIEIKNDSDHKTRQKVDVTVYTDYHEQLFFFALSMDDNPSIADRSLTSYGKVAAILNDEDFLRYNATLLEENSYAFYERHDLGRLKAVVPKGHRAVWADRGKLAVAKNQKDLNAALSDGELRDLVIKPGRNHDDDRFIEIVVFLDRGKLAVGKFARLELVQPLTAPDEQDGWDQAKASAKSLGVSVIELGKPA